MERNKKDLQRRGSKEAFGVNIHQSINIRMKNSGYVKYYLLFFRLLLLYMATVSTIFCYIQAMRLSVDVKQVFTLGFLFCLLFWAVWLMKPYVYTTIPLILFAFFLYLYQHLREIINGFLLVENQYIGVWNQYFKATSFCCGRV